MPSVDDQEVYVPVAGLAETVKNCKKLAQRSIGEPVLKYRLILYG
jgi:hypothetical protein